MPDLRMTLKKEKKKPSLQRYLPVAFKELIPNLSTFGQKKARSLASYYTGPIEHGVSREGGQGYRGQLQDSIRVRVISDEHHEIFTSDPSANFNEFVWGNKFFRPMMAAVERKGKRDFKKIANIYRNLPLSDKETILK